MAHFIPIHLSILYIPLTLYPYINPKKQPKKPKKPNQTLNIEKTSNRPHVELQW